LASEDAATSGKNVLAGSCPTVVEFWRSQPHFKEVDDGTKTQRRSTGPKDVEHTASLYHGDGLLDIAIGLVILLAGAAEVLDRTSFAAIWVVLWLPIMRSAKESITVRRMRTIDFTPAPNARRRMKQGIVTAVLALAVLLTLGLVLFTKNEALLSWLTTWPREYARVFWSAVLVGAGGLIALGTGIKRLHAYTALAVILFAVSYRLNLGYPLNVYLTVSGAIILLSGMVILARLLYKYPIAKDAQLQAADRRSG
jgi:hypothetical protein